MTSRLGAFPFEEYGVLGTPVGGELENQTLSLLSLSELKRPREVDGVMLHELVHQWFGDSVSVEAWSDLWLAEGHAVYYQMLYEHRGSPTQLALAFAALRRTVQSATKQYGPIAAPTTSSFNPPSIAPYGPTAYLGGALALRRLERDVGEQDFGRVERIFVRKFAHSHASTADYLRIVRQVAGPAPTTRLRAFLYRRSPV